MLETTGDLFAQNVDGVAVAANAVVHASGRSYLEASAVPASARWPDFDLILGTSITKNGLQFARITDANRKLYTPEGKEYSLPYDLYIFPVSWTWWGPIDLALLAQAATQLARITGTLALPHLDGKHNRRDAWQRSLPILLKLFPDDRLVVVKPTLTQNTRSVSLPKIPDRFFNNKREVRQNGRKPYSR